MTERQIYYHKATRRGPAVNWTAGVAVVVWGLLFFTDVRSLVPFELLWLDQWIQPIGAGVIIITLFLRWMLLRRSGEYVELDDSSIRRVGANGDGTRIAWTDVVDLRTNAIHGSFELVESSDRQLLPLNRGLEDYWTLMTAVVGQLDRHRERRWASDVGTSPAIHARTFALNWRLGAGLALVFLIVLFYASRTDLVQFIFAALVVAAWAASVFRRPYKVVVDTVALRLCFPLGIQHVALSDIVDCSLLPSRNRDMWLLEPVFTIEGGDTVVLKGFYKEAFALYDQIQRARSNDVVIPSGDPAPNLWQPKVRRRTLIAVAVMLLVGISYSFFTGGIVMVSAARSGREPILRMSLQLGADVDVRDGNRRTPLYEAAKYGQLEIVRLLVERGADLHAARDHPEMTPLHVAAEYGQLEAVRFLLEIGADANVENVWQQTPLSQLAWHAQENGAEIAAHLLAHGADLNSRDNRGFTPLHRAVRYGKVPFTRYLAANGADVNARTDQGGTVLQYALENGQLEAALVVVEAGALVDAVNPESGKSMLANAVQRVETPVVEFLLRHGARSDLPDNDGWSPLHIAAYDDRVDYVRSMLDAGADIELPGPNGRLLELAARFGTLEMVNLLLARGAQPNTLDEEGWAPLHYAAHDGNVELVKAMLDVGADPNVSSDSSPPPVWWAASEGHAEVVQLLWERGADVNELYRRWTPLAASLRQGHTEVATLLRSLGARD